MYIEYSRMHRDRSKRTRYCKRRSKPRTRRRTRSSRRSLRGGGLFSKINLGLGIFPRVKASRMGPHLEIVIARYREDIRYFKHLPIQSRIIVYNKGPIMKLPMNVHQMMLPNIGREAHTYLYHIIENYDNLADVTLFLLGSAMELWLKKRMFISLLQKIPKVDKNSFYCPGFKSHVDPDFQLDVYASTTKSNRAGDTALQSASIRPFGKWYAQKIAPARHTLAYPDKRCYFGLFVVGKNRILRHPKSFYKSLLRELTSSPSANPEVGHYFERAWHGIFG